MKEKNSPKWNPENPVEVTPEEYEKQVISWLKSAGAGLLEFSVSHLKKIQGSSGEYSIDGWVEFEVLGGAKVCVLVECKRRGRPVERDVILGVHAKAQEIGAQKSIVFSTSGFQRGAVEFASSASIALVIFVDGKLTYVTRSKEPLSEASYPPDLPDFAGQMIRSEGNITTISTITDDRINPLADWFKPVRKRG
ncbi:restriction endonuclease [Litoreibacter albidus]|uniref:Restriction system protein n=1 Tax=Litoreibacter albidus TaxID=670155 RepID=A0A1H3C0S6_9RHOB|nr:restriction endonuclease [Litoreibacter albidus]SDX47641.1 restriction system protein [Litoreibacter albidus]